jgi:hypothetical protein
MKQLEAVKRQIKGTTEKSPAQVTNHRRPERMQGTRKIAAFYCSK